MNDLEKKILRERLIPCPRKIDFSDGEEFNLKNGCSVELYLPETAELRQSALSFFQMAWGIVPALQFFSVREIEMPGSEDAYRVSVSGKVMRIYAAAREGMLNALKTLRQLAEVNRGTFEVTGYFLPSCEIEDTPAFAFRGIHLCVFPETTFEDMEKRIRLAAYHKYNYAVIEFWGVFPFSCCPRLGYREFFIDKEKYKSLIRLGKELGITLCPQFNLLGHASNARGGAGKHAILDHSPELQPLFEPDGWTWCLTNPETKKLLTNVVLELLDFFEDPPYFHIGCDEAHNMLTCRDCRREDPVRLISEHISRFRDLAASRGTRLIMWHDMLFVRRPGDALEHYVCNGKEQHHTDELRSVLPKDIIIAAWHYNLPGSEPGKATPELDWLTHSILKKEGFDVIFSPWMAADCIRSQGRSGMEKKLFGPLQTTWHKFNSYPQWYAYYGHGAEAAWGQYAGEFLGYNGTFTLHLREMCHDMKEFSSDRTGFCKLSIAKDSVSD